MVNDIIIFRRGFFGVGIRNGGLGLGIKRVDVLGVYCGKYSVK